VPADSTTIRFAGVSPASTAVLMRSAMTRAASGERHTFAVHTTRIRKGSAMSQG